MPRETQPSRTRILNAAIKIFAVEGYEKTTIRAIAQMAKLSPAMVLRYFGSKDALFAAASRLDLETDSLADVPRQMIGEAMVRHMLERWENERTGQELSALVRSSVSHESARARLIVMLEDQVKALIRSVRPAGEIELVTAMVAAQMLGIAMTRYVFMLPSMVSLSQDTIVERAGAAIQQYLDD